MLSTLFNHDAQALDQLPSSADQIENFGARCCRPLRARAETGPGVFSPLLESGRKNSFLNLRAIFPRSPKGYSVSAQNHQLFTERERKAPGSSPADTIRIGGRVR